MIYITGDTHGPTRLGLRSVDGYASRFNMANFPEQKQMTRDDYVIVCGDFGGIWDYDSRYGPPGSSFRKREGLACGESKEEKYWLDWLQEKRFTLLFCDGNHENFDRLEKAYEEKGLDLAFFMLTDIIEETTTMLCYGNKAETIVEDAFHVPVNENVAVMKGVVSRKKQVVPGIMAALAREAEET